MVLNNKMIATTSLFALAFSLAAVDLRAGGDSDDGDESRCTSPRRLPSPSSSEHDDAPAAKIAAIRTHVLSLFPEGDPSCAPTLVHLNSSNATSGDMISIGVFVRGLVPDQPRDPAFVNALITSWLAGNIRDAADAPAVAAALPLLAKEEAPAATAPTPAITAPAASTSLEDLARRGGINAATESAKGISQASAAVAKAAPKVEKAVVKATQQTTTTVNRAAASIVKGFGGKKKRRH